MKTNRRQFLKSAAALAVLSPLVPAVKANPPAINVATGERFGWHRVLSVEQTAELKRVLEGARFSTWIALPAGAPVDRGQPVYLGPDGKVYPSSAE